MTPKTKFLSFTTEDANMEYKFNVLITEVELDNIGQDVLWWQSGYLAGKNSGFSPQQATLPQPHQQLTIITIMCHNEFVLRVLSSCT